MTKIFTVAFFTSLVAATIRAGTPLLFALLGEIITERGGVLNLGVEGMMISGALAGFMGAFYFGTPWVGVLLGALAGGLLAFIHAFLSVTLKAEQPVSGITLVLLGLGLTSFLGEPMAGKQITKIGGIAVPYLCKIPILGPALFQQDILVYIAILLVPALALLLYRTRWGLNIIATGENPGSADSLGVNVIRVRYLCTLFGGLLAGVGGAYLSLAYTPMWVDGMTAGRGWIVIALVIFASWDPFRALAAAYLFGGVDALQMRLQIVGIGVPVQLLQMLPYLVTLALLVFSARQKTRNRISAPAALGVPYDREEA